MHACRSLLVAALFTSAAVTAGVPAKTSDVGRQSATAPPAVKGVWKIVEQFGRSPDGEWTAGATPYLSLYIFTDKHYSYMFVPGPAPRRLFAGNPNQPTDPEKVAAYIPSLRGSKDVSRRVAAETAAQTGFGPDVMKRMLPLVATLVMGAMSRQAAAGGASSLTTAAGRGSLLEMLGGALDSNKDGSALDDITGMIGRTFGRS